MPVPRKSCKAFSSNFLAARKGSSYMKEVWEAQKKAMTSHCESHDDRDTKVCCPADPKRKCHVHWGAIGEMVSHPVFDKFAAANPSMKKHCFAEEEGESFAPEGMGTVLFTKRKLQDALPFFTSIKTKKPMDRLAYHLFNAQGFQREYAGGAIFDSALFVGALKSLGNSSAPPKGPADDGPAEYCASEGENCPCSGRVFFGRKFDNDKDGDKLELSEMVLQQYRMMEVNGDIACTTSGFMGDPQINRPKQCLCQAMKGGPAPRSPAEDGPATICANEGEMCECEGKAYYGRKFSIGKDSDSFQLRSGFRLKAAAVEVGLADFLLILVGIFEILEELPDPAAKSPTTAMASPTLRTLSGLPGEPTPLKDSALVIIDAQQTYREGVMKLEGVEPALEECAALLKRARAEGATVVHIQHDAGEGSPYDLTQPVGQIAEPVAPVAGEEVIVKKVPNSFHDTTLHQYLQDKGVKSLVLCGFMAHMCVNSTARGAFNLGYASTVVASATATRSLADPITGEPVEAALLKKSALTAISDVFAVIVPTADKLP
eukprot:s587_g2.t1